ncbi:MAG: beta-lactamase family protein [Alistipes sp.]|nr:beta-lactamase family protein [Alistipes sp.]
MRKITLLFLLFMFAPAAEGRNIPASAIERVDALMREGLDAGYYPGASIAIGNRDGIAFQRCYGFRDNTATESVTPDDVYDIASLTKVVAMTFALMRLYDQDRIDLNRTVGDYVGYYSSTPVAGITISQLLTHTSGLPYFPAYSILFSNAAGGPYISNKLNEELFPYPVDKNCYRCALAAGDPAFVSRTYIEGYRRAGENTYINPGVDSLVVARIKRSYNANLRGKYSYSDTNFLILRQIVEAVTGQRLDEYTRVLFDELGMYSTGYNPLEWKVPEMIIPTELDYLMDRGQLRGYVHDDLAAVNDNIEGNAGLFSTASDLARFCEMLLGEGRFRGRRIISERTVRLFTSSPLEPRGIYRGLGFDKRGSNSSLHGGFGHTGYTGTMIWIDPKRDIFMVFLSNRVHPTRLNNGLVDSQLRNRIWAVIKASV